VYFNGEQNKSRWERGGKKNLKKVLIFFQCCQGGDQKNFFARLRAQIVPPPKQKPSYAPGLV